MANVLQDYFDRLTAVNRQRGMTGNMQYGQKMDASLAEGYFDSYQKNKKDSQDLALRQQALDDQRVYQQGSLANQTRSIDATSLAQQNQTDMYKQALGNQNTWQAITALGQVGAAGAGLYQKQQEQNRLNPPTQPSQTYTPWKYDTNSWQGTNTFNNTEYGAETWVTRADGSQALMYNADTMGSVAPEAPGYSPSWSTSFSGWIDNLLTF